MKYIALTDGTPRRLSFYLAMEEYAARHLDEDDLFFMWQVQPSVIFGRNQLIANEVNLEYCHQHGIQTYRRKSGGGCVYADLSNVMFSYITRSEHVALTYNRYINMVVLVLRKLGVSATSSGRNDVLIDGRKVSGNAFYHLPGRSIVHGTMLYDTNMQHMVGAITPTSEKLRSKGVESVRQHIALLKDYISLDIEAFKTFVRSNLCDSEIVLGASDVQAIEALEQEYLSDEFIYGNDPKYSVVRRARIEGVGEFEARMELKSAPPAPASEGRAAPPAVQVIHSLNLMGDYFLVGEIDPLLRSLRGVPLVRADLEAVLPDRLDDIVLNLTKAEFINLLLQQ